MSESKDVRKRKFHCEKEDMINKQKDAMKLKPIGTKAGGDVSDEQGSDSDSASEKDEWLCYDYSDIEEEFKPKPAADINAEDISSDEEEILTKPPLQNNDDIKLENLEEISSDENNDDDKKASPNQEMPSEHMESISSDEEELANNSKDASLLQKDYSDNDVDKIKAAGDTISDIENVSSIDEKELNVEKKSMEEISSDDQDDLPNNKLRKLSENLEAVSSDDEHDEVTKDSFKESEISNIELTNNTIITESQSNGNLKNVRMEDISDDELKESCNKSIVNNEGNEKLDSISSDDEDTWDDSKSKISIKREHSNDTKESTPIQDELDQARNDPSTSDGKHQDADSISSEEGNMDDNNSSLKEGMVDDIRGGEDISSADDLSLESESEDENEDNLVCDGRYEFDYKFFVKDIDYTDSEDKSSQEELIEFTEADLLVKIKEEFMKTSDEPLQKVCLTDNKIKTSSKYKRLVVISDCTLRNVDLTSIASENMLYCSNTLTLDQLTDTVKNHVLSCKDTDYKNNTLLVCCVGIIDIINNLCNKKIFFDVVEDVIRQMKRFHQFFSNNFSESSNVVFTSIRPIDVKAVLQAVIEDKNIAMASLKTISAKIFKIIYLIEKNMTAENLSRVKDMPSWNLFLCSKKLDQLINDLRQGNSLSFSDMFSGIFSSKKCLCNVKKNIVKLFKCYNKRNEITLEENKAHIKNIHLFTCYDISSTTRKWCSNSNINVKIHTISSLALDNVIENVSSVQFSEPNTLLVIQLGINDVLTFTPDTSCKDHEPLKQVSLNSQLTDENKIESFEQNFVSVKKQLSIIDNITHVVFTNIFYIHLFSYHKRLLENHFLATDHSVMVDESLKEVNYSYMLGELNHCINQHARCEGLPSWDLLYYMSARQDGSYSPQVPLTLLYGRKEHLIGNTVIENLANIFSELTSQTEASLTAVNKLKVKEIQLKKKLHKVDKSRTPSLSPPPTEYSHHQWKGSDSYFPNKKEGYFAGKRRDGNSWNARNKYNKPSEHWQGSDDPVHKQVRQVSYPKRKSYTRSPSEGKDDSRVVSYPLKYDKDHNPDVNSKIVNYTYGGRKSNYSDKIHRQESTHKSSTNIAHPQSNARSRGRLASQREKPDLREEFFEKKPRRLVSREVEEWDHKEKKSRRVVNYGRLSDEEGDSGRRKYNSDEDEEKGKSYRYKKDGYNYDGLSSSKRSRKSYSRSPERKYPKYRNEYSSSSSSKDYGKYKDESSTSKSYRKNDEDDVIAIFSNLKFISKNITTVKLSNSWIRIMYDNAVQLKNKKEYTNNVIDKDAIMVLKDYRSSFKKELEDSRLCKSDQSLLKETISRINDLLTRSTKADPYLGMDIKALASTYMETDTEEILKNIRSYLSLTGYSDVKEDTVMQIYIAIKVEQEKIKKDSSRQTYTDPTATASSNAMVYSAYCGDKTNLHGSNYSQVNTGTSLSLPTHQMQIPSNSMLHVPPPPIISNYQSHPSMLPSQHIPPPAVPPTVPPPQAMSTIMPQMSGGYMHMSQDSSEKTYSQITPQSSLQVSYTQSTSMTQGESFNHPPPLPSSIPPQPPPPSNISAYHTTTSTALSQPYNNSQTLMYGLFNSIGQYPPPNVSNTQSYSQIQSKSQNDYYNQSYQQQSADANNIRATTSSYTSEPSQSTSTTSSAMSFKDLNGMKPEQLIEMFSQFQRLPTFQQTFLLQVLDEFKRRDPTLAETVKQMMGKSTVWMNLSSFINSSEDMILYKLVCSGISWCHVPYLMKQRCNDKFNLLNRIRFALLQMVYTDIIIFICLYKCEKVLYICKYKMGIG